MLLFHHHHHHHKWCAFGAVMRCHLICSLTPTIDSCSNAHTFLIAGLGGIHLLVWTKRRGGIFNTKLMRRKQYNCITISFRLPKVFFARFSVSQRIQHIYDSYLLPLYIYPYLSLRFSYYFLFSYFLLVMLTALFTSSPQITLSSSGNNN